MRARRAYPGARLPAMLRPTHGRARTRQDALRGRNHCAVHHARHDGTHLRRATSKRIAFRRPRARAVAPRTHNQPRCGCVQGMGCAFDLGDERRDARVACGVPGSSERSARLIRTQPSHRDSRDEQFVGSRSADGRTAGSSSASMRSASSIRPIRRWRRSSRYCACAALTRSPCFSSVARPLHRAFSQASPGRARRARSRPRQRHTSRELRALWHRTHAPRVEAAFSREQDHRAAPSRCLEARAQQRRRVAQTRFNAPSGSPAASARAAAVISESIRIPSNLSHSVTHPHQYRTTRSCPRRSGSQFGVNC
jgi:hypothetical protein